MKEKTTISLGWVLLAALIGVLAIGAGYESPSGTKDEALRLSQMATVIYSASSTVTYVATALPGTACTDYKWQVKKITQTGSTAPYSIYVEWASGSNSFNHMVGTTKVKCESMLAENYQ